MRISRAPRTLAFYAYWEGLDLPSGEVFSGGRRVVGAWPTDDGQVITYCAWPASELAAFRRDPGHSLLASLDGAGDLGEWARAARRVSPVRATTDLPNEVRASHGPGWVLAGDAGLVMDPITGQGIGNAFRDADLLSAALVDGLGGRRDLTAALARYVRQRDRATRAMFDFTVGLASLRPTTPGEQRLFAAIAERPDESDRFLAVMSGVAHLGAFFSPGHVVRLVGLRGLLDLARDRHPVTRRRKAKIAALTRSECSPSSSLRAWS